MCMYISDSIELKARIFFLKTSFVAVGRHGHRQDSFIMKSSGLTFKTNCSYDELPCNSTYLQQCGRYDHRGNYRC
jgi:hypothetical protein